MLSGRQSFRAYAPWLLLSLLVLSAATWTGVQQPLTIAVGSVTARPFLQGFHEAEQLEPAGGATSYRWTAAEAKVLVPDAAWPSARRLSLRLIRFDAVPGPLVLEAGDWRVSIGDELTQGGSARRYELWLPPTDAVTLRSPQAQIPPGDARVLGNAIDEVQVQRAQGGLPAPQLLLGWAVVVLLHWRLAGLAGLQRADVLAGGVALLTALALAVAAAAGAVVLLVPALLVPAAAVLAASPLLVRGLRRRYGDAAGPLAAAMLLGIFWKAVALGYPGFFATDSQFHVHRMAAFLQGELFQTSLGGGTAFPYPLGGYITLLPLVALTNELRWTLQIAALVLDASTVLLLAEWVRGQAQPRQIGHGALIYVLLPVGYIQTFHNPVLHIVGQWLGVAFLTLLITTLRAPDGVRRWWPLTLAALAASLGHFGIFLNLGLMMLVAVLLQPRTALVQWRTLSSYAVGVVLSVLLFYGTAFDWTQARIGSGGEALQGTYGLTTHSEIVSRVLLVYGLWDHYLLVFVPLGIVGVVRWWRATAGPERTAPWFAAAMLVAGALVMGAVATVLFSGTRYMAFMYAPVVLGSAYLTAAWAERPIGQWAVRLLLALTGLAVLATWFTRFALNLGYWYLL